MASAGLRSEIFLHDLAVRAAAGQHAHAMCLQHVCLLAAGSRQQGSSQRHGKLLSALLPSSWLEQQQQVEQLAGQQAGLVAAWHAAMPHMEYSST